MRPCESLRVLAKSSPNRPPRPGNVVAFPVFERHGDQILDWLLDLGEQKPEHRAVTRVLRSMRRTAARLERVRNSMRHSNLASFLRHAANALEASEWDGARYLLMTSHALMTTRAITGGGFPAVAALRYLPLPEAATRDEPPAGVLIGIVTG